MGLTHNFSTPSAPPNFSNYPTPPPKVPTRSTAPAAKRGKLFYAGIAGIASGGVCCLLSLTAFILAGTLNQNAAPGRSGSPTETRPAATETSLPTQTQTPTEQYPGVDATRFDDDFSSSNSGWYVGSTNEYEASYFQEQSYAMGVKTPNFYFISPLPNPFLDPIQNIVISVRGKLAIGDTGEIGIVCRYQDFNNFYLASISGDRFYMGKKVNGTWSYLGAPNLQALPSSMPDQDGYLAIGLSCIGSSIVLEVNGIEAASVTDNELNVGDVGLYVWGGDQVGQSGYYAQAYFDDFSASLP